MLILRENFKVRLAYLMENQNKLFHKQSNLYYL